MTWIKVDHYQGVTFTSVDFLPTSMEVSAVDRVIQTRTFAKQKNGRSRAGLTPGLAVGGYCRVLQPQPREKFDVRQNGQPCCRTPYANEVSMFVNVNSGRPKLSNELGALSRKRVAHSEFRYARDAEIFGEAEPADFVYQVVNGAVRSYKLLADGRRQISAFHLPGDVFGIENGSAHRFTAEAVVDTTVLLRKCPGVDAVEQDASVVQQLLRLATKNLIHAEDHMLLLGRKTSLERVVAFLVEMDRRLTSAGIMDLPMNRRDIADYLGLTIETVSRALSMLQSDGVLSFEGKTQRQIVLLDRNKLTQIDTEG